jgi:hypothetical protein
VDAFGIFGSEDALEAAQKDWRRLAERFPPRGDAAGALETDLAAAQQRFDEMKAEYYRANAGQELERLERLASLLDDAVAGYRPMAAIYYREIVRRFGYLETDERFTAQIQTAREAVESLSGNPEVGTSIPPMPADEPR